MSGKKGARSLARRYYSDPIVFEREREQIFARHWFMLGRVEELFAKLNDSNEPPACRFLTETVAGSPVLLIQDGAAEIRAYHNVCRHRGALLVDAVAGSLENGVLTCPYHAWTYSCHGELIGAPNMRELADFCRAEHGLHPIEVRIWHGFLLVNLAIEPSPFEADRLLGNKLNEWRVEDLRVGARLEYSVNANWKLLFENYSECYHCPTVHPALNLLTPYRGAENEFVEGPVLGGPMSLAEGVETMSSDGRYVASPFSCLSRDELRKVFYFTLLPNYFLSLHPDYVLVHRLNPVTHDLTRVSCEFLLTPNAGGSWRMAEAVEFWDLTNRQDWEMCERVQSGSRSLRFEPGRLSNLESMVAAFDRHYLGLMAEQPRDAGN